MDYTFLRLCPICQDRYVTDGNICHLCKEQEMIDEAEPPEIPNRFICANCGELLKDDETQLCWNCEKGFIFGDVD